MIMAVIRPAVRWAYLRNMKYVAISINKLNGKRMYVPIKGVSLFIYYKIF